MGRQRQREVRSWQGRNEAPGMPDCRPGNYAAFAVSVSETAKKQNGTGTIEPKWSFGRIDASKAARSQQAQIVYTKVLAFKPAGGPPNGLPGKVSGRLNAGFRRLGWIPTKFGRAKLNG